jgi:hypothetical protein
MAPRHHGGNYSDIPNEFLNLTGSHPFSFFNRFKIKIKIRFDAATVRAISGSLGAISMFLNINYLGGGVLGQLVSSSGVYCAGLLT